VASQSQFGGKRMGGLKSSVVVVGKPIYPSSIAWRRVNWPFATWRTHFSNVWLGIPSTLAVAAQDWPPWGHPNCL